MPIGNSVLNVIGLGVVLLPQVYDTHVSSPFEPVDQFVKQAVCGQIERRENTRVKPKYRESGKFQIAVNLAENWDESSVPIPLNIIVCNNGSEGATLLTFELIIKDINGTRILPSDETMTGIDGADKKSLKVLEFSARGPSIEPKKEFSRTLFIGKEYDLIPSKEYTVTIRQLLYLPGSAKMIELTSLPIKLILKAPEK
jgi:hypothetical protein